MGLFGRRVKAQSSEELPATEVEGPDVTEDAPARPEHGPWDASQVENAGASRVDLGAILLPGVEGMQVRMELDKATQAVTGVSVMVDGSVLQVQAFAAPRVAGIWDEIRDEIRESLTKQGASVDDIPGRFGRELFVKAPATDGEGKAVVRVIRFLGVDGPRWFLRGVLTGKATVDSQAAGLMEALFSQVVVVRDEVARAPRELLPLHLPQQPELQEVGSQAPAPVVENADEVAELAPAEQPAPADEFNPLERGPEITEIR